MNRKKNNGKRRVPTVLKVFAVILCLIAAGAIVFKLWIKAPPQPSPGLHNPNAAETGTAPSAPSDPAATPGTPSSAPKATTAPETSDDIYTFAVVGRDKGGSNTDTIMIARFDTGRHKIDVVSIPRDTLANVPQENKRVNAIYAYSMAGGKSGPEGLMEGLRDMLGFSLGNHVIIDLQAFEQVVDAVGGITYNVPVDMVYDDPDQNLHISLRQGEQKLSGLEALGVLRFRAGYPDADIGRIRTQQDFLMTAAKEILSLGNIPNLPKIVEIIANNTETNLTAANLMFFATELLKCKPEDISFHTMPFSYNDEGIYLLINIPEWLKMVNEYLNPYEEQVTERNCNIITKIDGQYYSTTGTYANLTGPAEPIDGFVTKP